MTRKYFADPQTLSDLRTQLAQLQDDVRMQIQNLLQQERSAGHQLLNAAQDDLSDETIRRLVGERVSAWYAANDLICRSMTIKDQLYLPDVLGLIEET